MKKMSELINSIPDHEKEKKWENIRKRWIELGEMTHNKYANILSATNLYILAKLFVNHIDGGPCPICDKPWKKVDFDNILGKGWYYIPDCYCYAICPHCGDHLEIEEVTKKLERNNYLCPSCQMYKLYVTSPNGKRIKAYGPNYEAKSKRATEIRKLSESGSL